MLDIHDTSLGNSSMDVAQITNRNHPCLDDEPMPTASVRRTSVARGSVNSGFLSDEGDREVFHNHKSPEAATAAGGCTMDAYVDTVR